MFGFHRHHRHHHHCRRGEAADAEADASADGWPDEGHHGHHGHGHGHGPRGWFFRRRRRHFWRRRGLGGLMSHLGATPAQERVVREEVHQVRALTRELRGELGRTRADVGRAIGGEQFDAAALAAAFARHDEALRQLRAAVVGGLERIHATLDAEQRARLVKLLGGAPAGPGGGPFRSPPEPV